MKVLQLCLRMPWPPNDGGTIAMYNMSESLTANHADVKVVAFNTKKHFVEPSDIPSGYLEKYQPEMVYLDATVKIIPAFLNLFSTKSYNISRFDIEEMHLQIKSVLEKDSYDIIQLESLFMAPYIPTIRQYSDARIILRAHNVEFRIWERLAESCESTVKRWYLSLLASRLKTYESSVLNEFDGILALTDEDKHLFRISGCSKSIGVVPISIDTACYRNNAVTDPQSVFHLGSMDWLPNLEAIEWFLKNVLPKLKNQVSRFSLHLAGKAMPDSYFRISDEMVRVTGKVDDARKFMADKQIMIVPLLSGGGMRVKIIEGMAMGKTIISTTIGAEGIKYTSGVDILIADTPEEFAEAMVRCLEDPAYCRRIGDNAAMLAARVYDNKVCGTHILQFYQKILSKTETATIHP